MKKKYISPEIKAKAIKPRTLLAGSVRGNGNYNMRYGGVDENGEYIPE